MSALGGMSASFDYGEDVRVFPGGSASPFVAYAGPFRFVATGMQANRNVQFNGLTDRLEQFDYPGAAALAAAPPSARAGRSRS